MFGIYLNIVIANENLGRGGAERYTAELARGLARRGHRVTLAARSGSWLLQQPWEDVTVRGLPYTNELDIVTLARLVYLGRKSDIIHCQASRDLTLWGMLPTRARFFKSEHTFLEPHRSFLLDRAYRRSHVLAVSQALKEQLLRELPGLRVSVLPNGIDLEAFSSLPEPLEPLKRHRWIGCLAALIPGKGQDDLIEAFARLDDPELRLLLAGDGPERPRLQALASRLGERVWFCGHLDDPRRALAGLSVAVVPSHKETFSLACLEALAAGVPLVASRTGGIPEVVGEAALLVEPGRPQELGFALNRALRDPPRGGPERARGFSQEAMLDRLEELYRA